MTRIRRNRHGKSTSSMILSPNYSRYSSSLSASANGKIPSDVTDCIKLRYSRSTDLALSLSVSLRVPFSNYPSLNLWPWKINRSFFSMLLDLESHSITRLLPFLISLLLTPFRKLSKSQDSTSSFTTNSSRIFMSTLQARSTTF